MKESHASLALVFSAYGGARYHFLWLSSVGIGLMMNLAFNSQLLVALFVVGGGDGMPRPRLECIIVE